MEARLAFPSGSDWLVGSAQSWSEAVSDFRVAHCWPPEVMLTFGVQHASDFRGVGVGQWVLFRPSRSLHYSAKGGTGPVSAGAPFACWVMPAMRRRDPAYLFLPGAALWRIAGHTEPCAPCTNKAPQSGLGVPLLQGALRPCFVPGSAARRAYGKDAVIGAHCITLVEVGRQRGSDSNHAWPVGR